MLSLSERQVRSLMLVSAERLAFFAGLLRLRLARVYPKAHRVDSSNLDPVPFWNAGVQMAALNLQTGDRSTQLNAARFAANGHCGYVLKPQFGRSGSAVVVQILCGRMLASAAAALFVEVEVCGAEEDSCKRRTRSVTRNGYNPHWDEEMTFRLQRPELALIR
jgi:hypothetical protein